MTQTSTESEYVYSRLGSDPNLADIVDMFVNEMPNRVELLLDSMSKGDWDAVRQAAHRLKGAAGSYGFDAISPVAGKLEAAVLNKQPEEDIGEAVADLIVLCRRVRCGMPPAKE
jgi:histidine phosphotransfer protein HptB